MSRTPFMMLAAAALLWPAPAPQGPPQGASPAEEGLAFRAVRYYRADANKTLVKAFVQVPYDMLTPGGSGPDAVMTYQFTARVVDASGMSLLSEPLSWRTRVPATMKDPRAFGLEQWQFAVDPGKYRIEVTVQDSVSLKELKAAIDVEGYPAMPEASDLLLSPSMRPVTAADSVPGPGEMRLGGTLVAPAALLRITPLRPAAYYVLEAYTSSQQDEAGTMDVSIVDGTGKSLLKTASTPVRVGPGGAILKGQVNLDGLPEGDYTLQVTVGLGGRTTQRAAKFEMAGMEVFEKSADLIEFAQRTDEGFFGAMNEAQLDSAQAPLIYVAGSRELNTYKSLSVDAKRRFLIEFWKKRDQDKATTINEERERFYGAIAYANEKFRVGRGKQEIGWRTDRGRIYAKLGAPDETLRRNQQGLAPPYEVWRYTRGRARYYVFADRTMIGAYNLIHTNDLNENRSPGWREIITEQGVADVGRFLGVDFFREGGSSLNPIN